MINAVLPSCAPDYRNFMAVPAGTDLSTVAKGDNADGRAGDVWYAVPGDALIRVARADEHDVGGRL